MLETTEKLLTEAAVEKEMVRRFPLLYNIKLYSGIGAIALFAGIYILSFLLIAVIVVLGA